MRKHRQIVILKVGSASAVRLDTYTTYLRSMPHVLVSETAEVPASISDIHLAITMGDDHLLIGEPLAAPLSDSVKVVAILETAMRSMERGGSVEAVNA